MKDDDGIDGLLKLAVVMTLTAQGRTTIYNGVRAGTFPKPILVGKRGVAWIRSEVATWIKSRVEASRGKPDNSK